MFRFLRLIILLVLIATIVTSAYLWLTRVPTLERFLSQRFNTEATIGKVHLDWNCLTLSDVKLKNPSPATTPYAFQGGEISVEMDFFELFKKKVHIKQIKMKDAIISLEFYNYLGSDNNWARLLNTHESSTESERTFIIDKFVLDSIHFNAKKASGKEIPIPTITYLELDHLGAKHSLTLSQMGRLLFKKVLGTLSAKAYLGTFLDSLASVPENLIEKAEPLDKGVALLRKVAKEATNFFQSLF